MNKELLHIQRQINQVQVGLLRVHNNDELLTMNVTATANKDTSLNCIITDNSSSYRMADKNVHVIQKNRDNYLYITGKVLNEKQQKKKILSIRILKASWFVRKRKGGISWLKEKYVYETSQEL